ncbi:MAG TPA: 3-deoxy-D-manno-octulosonic acid kinase [Nevskiales bacterium]|nr:3-deoxy-D-manno-octulosonic acid kinase [Nevskiales bacterium]
MRPEYRRDGATAIVYDADRLDHADSAHFEPAYWAGRGALVGEAAGGRGTTLFVQQGAEQWALRHYRRGGFAARLVTDRYLWLGLERTRAWREWHLMAELHRRGLPVPAPVAARVVREGVSYSADLITRRLPGVEQLTQRLQAQALPDRDWRRLGGMLRRFHDAGLDHADLNADNILLSACNDFWLIDFDQARLRAPGRWREGNLLRLERSLKKRQANSPQFFWTGLNWSALRAGYESPPAGG